MDFDTYRPIISGVIGGILSTILCSYWAKFLPRRYSGKSVKQLVQENKRKIQFANYLFISCLLVNIGVYKFGLFGVHDWRGFGLFFGLAFFSPLVWLYLSSCAQGPARVTEAFVAYAVSQKTPIWLLYALMVAGSVLCFTSLAALVA